MLLLLGAAFAGSPFADLAATKATTAADEYSIGRELVASELWLSGPWENEAQQLRVERIARRVVAASDRPDLVFNVTLINDGEINACALPGGFLFVNRGLLEKVTDDELAFVVGHELSHVILRHSASTVNLKDATMAVTSLSGARAAGDRATAAVKEEELYLMMAGHSRQLELEADLYGMLYTVRAGYPAAAASDALALIQKEVGDVSASELPWASHPMFTERIAELHKGETSIRATVGEFDAGVAALRYGRATAAAECFQKFLTLFPQSPAGWADLGAAWLTVAVAESTDPWVDMLPLHTTSGVTVRNAGSVARERARDALIHAASLDPGDPVTLGLLGVLARMEDDPVSARHFFERGLSIDPDMAALHVDLGNVAAEEGKLDEALREWEKATKLAPGAPEPRVNTARAYTGKKQKKKATDAWTALLNDPRWGDDAAAALETLGTKAKAAKPEAKGVEKMIFPTGAVAPGDGLAAVTAILGEPDFTLDMSEEGDGSSVYFAWDDSGAEMLVTHDRVMSVAVFDEAEAHTTSGVALGGPESTAINTWGEPDDVQEFGHGRTMEWTTRGYGVGILEGVITELDLFRPE